MKVKYLCLIILVVVAMDIFAQPAMPKQDNRLPIATQMQIQSKSKTNELPNTKYLGYSVDGITSASKLAAQRSHTVAGKDERNFAIFTGIVVILIIFFLSQIEFSKY